MAKIEIVTADLHTLSSRLKQAQRCLKEAHQMVAAAQGSLSLQVSSRSAINSKMEETEKKLSLQRAKVGKMSSYSMQAAEEFADVDRKNGRNLSELFDNLSQMMGRMAGGVRHFTQSVTVQRHRAVAGIFLSGGSLLTVSGTGGFGHGSGGGRHGGSTEAAAGHQTGNGAGSGRHDGTAGAAAGGVLGAQIKENAADGQTTGNTAGSGRHDGAAAAVAGGVLGTLAAGGVIGAGVQAGEHTQGGQTAGSGSGGQTGSTAGGSGTAPQQPAVSTNAGQSGQPSGVSEFGGKLVSFNAADYKGKTNGTYKDYFVVPGMKPAFVILQSSKEYSYENIKIPNFGDKGCTCCTYWTIASAWAGSAKGKPTDSYLKSQLAAGSSTEKNPANIWEEAKKYTSEVQYLESVCRNLEEGIPIGLRVDSDSGGHTISCVGLKKGTDITALKQKVAALGKHPDRKAYDTLLKEFQNNILVSDSGTGKITTLDNFSILMGYSLWYPKGAPVIKK